MNVLTTKVNMLIRSKNRIVEVTRMFMLKSITSLRDCLCNLSSVLDSMNGNPCGHLEARVQPVTRITGAVSHVTRHGSCGNE
jgi:hypothetical protein